MGNSGPNTAKAVRFVVALVAVACFVLGGALTGAYLAIRHIVKTTTIDYAKAFDIAVEPTEVRFGLTFVQILDCRFVALQVPGVSGTVRRIDIDLSGLQPKSVLLTGVTVNAKGDPVELSEAAQRYWDRIRPKSATAPNEPALPKVEWQHLAVNLTTGNVLVPMVSLTELTVATDVGPTHDQTTIRTASTRAGTLDLGALEMAIRNQDGNFELGWGPTLLESKWRVAYHGLPNAAQIRFSFQPHATNELLGWLGMTQVPSALGAAKVAGHVEALRDRTSGKTKGLLTLNLVGFVPPFPPELKGYRFADTTTLRAQFDIDPLFFAAELLGIELKTGDVSLVGHGRIDRELFSARLRAELGTTLDCVTLAKGYASEAIGGELGQWGAKNAPRAVKGVVSVKVQVDADSSRLDDAKVVRRIGIGCGLKPMSIVELLNLGLPPIPDPKTVERLTKLISPETVLSNLPTLPRLLPSLDEWLDAPALGDKSKQPGSKGPKKATGAASGAPSPSTSARH